ncbi:uncharacterized protein LOC125840545 [Solanum verrucosum]|uniref:uncharacterized protein LOC125840545 n=1 Tax=Solanum verrucosum TaxID=315347 RepID=UPI0020CFFD65|nr:uncharacterized protein LOC125840545 [Solanum verrucosum]
MEAEIVAILKALRYCKIKKINKVLIETDSLGVIKMIRNEWKIPWNQEEEMEEIQEIIENIQADITHVFREANQLADKLVNEAYTHTGLKQWEKFQQLSGECKSILNADKSGKEREPEAGRTLGRMPIPDWKWNRIAMEFVVTYNAEKLAKLYIQEIFLLHGVSVSIISNRGMQFTSNIWRTLQTELGTRLDLSTAFHPLIDG